MTEVYRSPDGNTLAVEQPDGEFVEVAHEHGDGAWVSQGLLEVVPDDWDRLVREQCKPVHLALATSVEADTEHGMWYVSVLDADVHHTTEGAPVNLDWTREGNLVGIELLTEDGETPGRWPQGRVFLAGDTVPAGTPVVNHVGGVWRHHEDRVLKTGWAIEILLPSPEEQERRVTDHRQVRELAERIVNIVEDHQTLTDPAVREGIKAWRRGEVTEA